MDEIAVLKRFLSNERSARIEAVLSKRTREVCVVLDSIDKPHNRMAVFRTCEVFGIQDLHVIALPGQSGEAVSRSVTQGAHKWLTIRTYRNWRECFTHLKGKGYRLLAGRLSDDAVSMESLDLSGRVALVFGNELEGLEPGRIAACDGSFMLPMLGFSQSFNLSVACALAIQRLFLLREATGIRRGTLSESEKRRLRREWYRRAVDRADLILDEVRRRAEL